MAQIIASGGELNLLAFIGNHECSDFPPSLFQEDGSMRTDTKASLVKILKEETKVNSNPNLLQGGKKTAVVVDATVCVPGTVDPALNQLSRKRATPIKTSKSV